MTHSFSVERRWRKDMGGGPGLEGEGRWRRRTGGWGLMGSRDDKAKSQETLCMNCSIRNTVYCLQNNNDFNDLFFPLTTSEYLVSSKQTHSCFISIKRHIPT